jgi:hypothetical protein
MCIAVQAISELSLEVDALEGRLREAARAREAKLRRMRAPEGRATMPFQLKVMDEVRCGGAADV